MKHIFIIFTFAFYIVAARADFVIQQRIEGADQNGILTLKVKGDKTRLDMPTIRLGIVSVIQDLNTGDKIMMINEQKLAKMEPATESGQGNSSVNAQIPKLMNTGRTETIGNYNAAIYTWTNNRDMGGILWVATNYPDYSKIKNLLKKLQDSRAGQLLKNTQPNTSALPGMVIKSKKYTPLGEVTTTLLAFA